MQKKIIMIKWKQAKKQKTNTLSQLECTHAGSRYCAGDKINSAPAAQNLNQPDNCGETRVAIKTCLKRNKWLSLTANKQMAAGEDVSKGRWKATAGSFYLFLTCNFMRESDVSWWQFPPSCGQLTISRGCKVIGLFLLPRWPLHCPSLLM